MDAAVRVAVPRLEASPRRSPQRAAVLRLHHAWEARYFNSVNGEVQIKEYHQFSKSIQMRQDFENKGIV